MKLWRIAYKDPRSLVCIVAVGFHVTAANALEPAPFPFRNTFAQVSNATLAGVRGGFEVSPSLEVSFGIERSVVIGGVASPATSFNVTSNGTVASTAAFGGVIQNATDGQNIKSVLTINVSANSLQVLKQGNLQLSIVDAVVSSRLR